MRCENQAAHFHCLPAGTPVHCSVMEKELTLTFVDQDATANS
jgi:hypothetical protein